MTESDPLAIAAALAEREGLPRPISLTRLGGGRNNRAFRVMMGESPPVVLKLYHTDSADRRDRLGAEFAFLRFAWERGVRCLPAPIACDPARNAALIGYLPGARPKPETLTSRHRDAALDFILALNVPKVGPSALAPASEACFSLDEHMATVARRVARLSAGVTTEPGLARAFVRERLVPTWETVKHRLMAQARAAGLDTAARLSEETVCASPSDFGYHNALVKDGVVRFLDFEYAGRDDPAKLVCDFFCQPEVPVPSAWFDDFVGRLMAGLGLGAADAARCAMLRATYRVKWACILLNEFLPQGAARRAFAAGADAAIGGEIQLTRAGTMLDAITGQGN